MYIKKYLETRTDDNEALFVSLIKPYNRLGISGIEILIRNLAQLGSSVWFEKNSRNNSLYLNYIVKKIAEIKGIPEDEVVKKTTENAYEVYGIKKIYKLEEL